MNEPRNEPRNVTPDDEWRAREAPRRRLDTGTVVWGLILIVVGGWFFLDTTLGLDMPNIEWDTIWPVVLIVIGAAVILQGLGRRRT
jgi:hypothetical protein